jgi:hypothetical protein
MGWKKHPPRDSGEWWEWFVPSGCFTPWLLSMAALAVATTLVLHGLS